MTEKCMVEGCDRDSVRRGCCNKHYRRWMKHGTFERQNPRAENGAPRKFLDDAINSDTDECIIWPFGKDSDGYGWLEGKAAHREACPGEPIGERNQACHSCNNPSCINPRHLRWATKSENMQDKHIHGTMPMGETHWRNK